MWGSIICTARFPRQALLLGVSSYQKLEILILPRVMILVYKIVPHSPTVCFPNIHRHVILVLSSLGLSNGCHSSGFAIVFPYPSNILAYAY